MATNEKITAVSRKLCELRGLDPDAPGPTPDEQTNADLAITEVTHFALMAQAFQEVTGGSLVTASDGSAVKLDVEAPVSSEDA